MPELPDVVTYLEAIERRVRGEPLERVRLASAFLLRSVEPPLSAFEGRRLAGTLRLGKRLVLEFEGELFLVLHLMIAGRLHWKPPGAKIPGGKRGLAAFDFRPGTLILTEAGTQKRAALHAVAGRAGLAEHDRGGLEVLESDLDAFRARLAERHTLKRSLTDPHLFSGIGNAYSDEILHRAGLSPLRWTTQLEPSEVERLYTAVREVLTEWTERLRREAGDAFPEKVTAFRPGMAVHGRYGEPCPRCGAPVQRILYATNEANYCAPCQTGGKLLADRALSRLMKEDWPRTLDELEQLRGRARGG
jgi:formamidopyrimidine-DNA glycosylase